MHRRIVIGKTPQAQARTLGPSLGAGRLYLKLEGFNPSGAHKDRAAAAMITEALSGGYRGLTAGTCGNLGISLSVCAAGTDLALTLFVPARYKAARIEEFQGNRVRVVRTAGGYEEAVAASVACARTHGLYDANPSGAGGPVSLSAYGHIAQEILSELGTPPDSVWVPAGNGTTAAGIGQAFWTVCGERSPMICAVGSADNTAAIRSVQAGHVVELVPDSLTETAVNEPLLNWKSLHSAELLTIVTQTRGLVHEASDPELVRMSQRVDKEEGLKIPPASCAGLTGLAWALATGRLNPGIHVAVITAGAHRGSWQR